MLHYFTGSLPNGFVALFSAKILNLIVAGLLGVFLPIFLYDLFDQNILIVFMWFSVASVLTLVTHPFAVKYLNIIGFRKSLQISSFLGSLYYVFYFFLSRDGVTNVIPLMAAITLTLVAWRSFYWLPYHITFTHLSAQENRGRQVSVISVMGQVASALMPLFAGIILLHYSYTILFVIGIILFTASAIPYRKIPLSREKYEWGYAETWKRLFQKQNRSILIPFMGMGAENTVGALIWPVFIFTLLQGNYYEVGALTTLIVIITIMAQLAVGKYLDEKHLGTLFIRYGTTLNALGWFFKAFVATALHIFVAGLYHSIVKVVTMTPVNTLMYEISADQGHYIDEYTVLHDMAMHVGRLIMLASAAILLVFLPLQWTFFIAAIASLTFNLITSKRISFDSIV